MKRNQSIELLRLLLMLLIVIEHVLGHGGGLLQIINNPSSENVTVSFPTWLLYACCVIAVNVFVFISGSFGIKINLKKLVDILLQAYSTGVIIFIVAMIVGMRFSTSHTLGYLMPITFNNWWFLSDYIVLMMLAPMLNQFTEVYSIKIQRCILLFLFSILYIGGLLIDTCSANLGYSIPCFVFLYILGRHTHQYNVLSTIPVSWTVCALFVITMLNALLAYNFQGECYVMQRIFAYNNPLVMLDAVLLYMLFYKIRINIDFRNVSKYAFGIYLFHDNSFVRENLVDWYNIMGGAIVPVIYVCCIMLEAVRQYIVTKLSNKLIKI